MKKTPRFFAALWAAKLTASLMKLFGRDIAHKPGSVAAKLCPDFLSRIDKPSTVIAVTGTNGKTAVCRLLVDLLTAYGEEPLHNLNTGNLQGGILSAFLNNCTLTGRFRQSLAVLEIDERSTVHIFKHITPDMLVVTNLFRGSFKRSVHSEFISSLLNGAIPSTTKLIVNADDLIGSSLAAQNDRVTFGIAEMPHDNDRCQNIVCDLIACPHCNSTLQYTFVRYNHIGRAYCPTCGFGSPAVDYEITAVDRDVRRVTLRTPTGSRQYPLMGTTVIDHYNLLAAVTVWEELGKDPSVITTTLPALFSHPTERSVMVKGKTITRMLAKCQNPTACSQAFEAAKNGTGTKAVVLLLDHPIDSAHSSENISWLYDTDFEFLAHDSIRQLLAVGSRAADIRVRLLLAGVSDDRIVCLPGDPDTAKYTALDDVDRVYILYDRFNEGAARAISERYVRRLNAPDEEVSL